MYCLIITEDLLLDARDLSEHAEAHILLAKGVKKDDKGERKIPFGVHLPSLLHCVVYDGNTVSIVEDSECCYIIWVAKTRKGVGESE